MTVRWFGPSWGAPCCDPQLHIDTPVGDICTRCEHPIVAIDQGIDLGYVLTGGEKPGELVFRDIRAVYHLNCWFDEVLPPMPDTFDGL